MMTKEEIIELARKAGVRDDEHIFEFSQYKYLERFAKLVAKKEREKCAKLCDESEYPDGIDLAYLIRARGQE